MKLGSRNGAAPRPLPPALVQYQWKPGQSGNPAGFGGEYQRCPRLCREASFEAAQEVIRLSRESEDDRVRFTAAAWVYEHGFGKPRDYNPSKDDAAKPKLNIEALPRAERDQLERLLPRRWCSRRTARRRARSRASPRMAAKMPETAAEPVSLALSPGALRMRHHRDRRKRGCRSLMIEIREAEVSELIRRGYLSADERGDGRAVRQAVHKLLDRIFSAR